MKKPPEFANKEAVHALVHEEINNFFESEAWQQMRLNTLPAINPAERHAPMQYAAIRAARGGDWRALAAEVERGARLPPRHASSLPRACSARSRRRARLARRKSLLPTSLRSAP